MSYRFRSSCVELAVFVGFVLAAPPTLAQPETSPAEGADRGGPPQLDS